MVELWDSPGVKTLVKGESIEVAADDMGLPSEVKDVSISLVEIRSSMEKHEVVFEAKPEGEDED